jgi:antitoxin MazE
MSGKIQKWGNSLGVRIPKNLIEILNLVENSEVEIEHRDGAIIISPVKNKFSLESLLNQITRDNCHHEVNSKSKGHEAWS